MRDGFFTALLELRVLRARINPLHPSSFDFNVIKGIYRDANDLVSI